MMRALGKDVVMFMSAGNFPLPHEYQNLPLDRVQNQPPPDMDERIAVFLDCGNIDRMPVDFLQRDGQHIVNIDHHHDNTHFGTVNLVVGDASCTAEILWELSHALGVEITTCMAEALYIALITDTGRFMYENTGARAHLMAAELIDAGVDVAAVYRRLYQDLPFPRLQLLARALAGVRRYDDGRVTVAHLGTTQAAWIFFFGQYAPVPRLLAFSLAAHLVFSFTRAMLGLAWLPAAYLDLQPLTLQPE
jgi:phosphoesterase RecJ-like protein